jgi:hypothetical protein
VLAVAGLEGPLGSFAGLTLIGLLAVLFTFFLRAMLRTADRADTNNAQAVKDRDAIIERLTAELDHTKKERDMWYRRAVGQQWTDHEKGTQ